jgi:hypothetical protein
MRLLKILVLCTGIPTAALAKCEHPPIPWSFGKSISTTWRTIGGSVCASANYHPQHIAKIEIETRPANGIAGKNGPFAVAYKPNPGLRDRTLSPMR